MNIYVYSLFSIWLLLINCTPSSAGWFGSCCEKEGWYYLDGGPFSWLFLPDVFDASVQDNFYEYIKQRDLQDAKFELHTYLGQQDYQAAKAVAVKLNKQ
jgi:hypothetical protein